MQVRRPRFTEAGTLFCARLFYWEYGAQRLPAGPDTRTEKGFAAQTPFLT